MKMGLPESIRLYNICAALEWSHLPVAGGIYDQHPQLLEEWQIIRAAEERERKRKEAQETRKTKSRRR